MATKKKEKITAQMISVDAGKLSQGLKTTFEGVAMVFDSLGVPIEMPLEEKKAVGEQVDPEPAADTPVEVTEEAEATPGKEPDEPVASETPEATAIPEAPAATAKPSVSIDDITKIIVQKIKQNRKNNEAIGAILKNYGVARVGNLHTDKYEAFLTDLSAI